MPSTKLVTARYLTGSLKGFITTAFVNASLPLNKCIRDQYSGALVLISSLSLRKVG